MEKYVERMVNEHKELVDRIEKLHDYIYSDTSDKDDKIEFANKSIQLSAMKKYAECLEARLFNKGVICEDGSYMERIA